MTDNRNNTYHPYHILMCLFNLSDLLENIVHLGAGNIDIDEFCEGGGIKQDNLVKSLVFVEHFAYFEVDGFTELPPLKPIYSYSNSPLPSLISASSFLRGEAALDSIDDLMAAYDYGELDILNVNLYPFEAVKSKSIRHAKLWQQQMIRPSQMYRGLIDGKRQ